MCIHSNLHIHVYARMWFEKDPACTILGFRREGGRETQNSMHLLHPMLPFLCNWWRKGNQITALGESSMKIS